MYKHQQLKIGIQDSCSWCNGTCSTLEALHNALYKSTVTTTTTTTNGMVY